MGCWVGVFGGGTGEGRSWIVGWCEGSRVRGLWSKVVECSVADNRPDCLLGSVCMLWFYLDRGVASVEVGGVSAFFGLWAGGVVQVAVVLGGRRSTW